MKLDHLDFDWPSLSQISSIPDLETWMFVRPFPRGTPEIPLFYTEKFGKKYPLLKYPCMFLEFSSHGPIWQMFVVWIPFVCFLWSQLVWTNIPKDVCHVINGFMTWTFAEYCIHRWIFHNHWLLRHRPSLLFLMHGVHHKNPYNPRRLTMPLLMSVQFAAPLIWVFFRLWNLHALCGFIIGYIAYDICHYLSHYSKSKSYLLQHHRNHHYVRDRKFGFTTKLFDRLFKTC